MQTETPDPCLLCFGIIPLKAQKEIEQIFRKWLGSDEALRLLKKYASKYARSDGLATYSGGVSEARDGDTGQDLEHELLAFILETYLPEAFSSPDRLNLLLQGQFQTFVSVAVKRFFSNMSDISRRSSRNPFRYLYRRFREVLKKSPLFVTGPMDASGMWVARSAKGQQVNCKGDEVLPGPEPDEIAFPLWLVDQSKKVQEEMKKGEVLLKLASYYLDEAGKIINRRCVPVREIVRFTAWHLPWLNSPVRLDAAGYGDQDSADGVDLIDKCMAEMPNETYNMEELAELSLSVKSMPAIARQFVDLCSPHECQVFILRMKEPPVKYKVIAEKMGLTDLNRAVSLFRSFSRKLEQFMRALPGGGIGALPQSAQLMFLETVKDVCKEFHRCP